MKSQLVLLICVVCSVRTLYVEPGCEVKSKWEIDYKWTDIDFSVWVPPGNESDILTIKIEFKEKTYPAYFDRIVLSNKEIQLQRIRNAKIISSNKTIFIADGWADFVLTVDSYYGLKHHNNTIIPLNISVDYMPKSLLINGSNITLHCPSKLRTWKVRDSYVPIPLDGSEEHRFSFYSTRNFSTSISLEEWEFKLGWNNGTLTTIPNNSRPLPPFVEHHLALTCQKNQEAICKMKLGLEMKEAESMRVGEIPKSVSFKGNPGDNFYVSLYQDDPISTSCEELSENGINFFFVALMVTTAICFLFIGKEMYIYWISRKPQEKELEEVQQRNDEDIGLEEERTGLQIHTDLGNLSKENEADWNKISHSEDGHSSV